MRGNTSCNKLTHRGNVNSLCASSFFYQLKKNRFDGAHFLEVLKLMQ